MQGACVARAILRCHAKGEPGPVVHTFGISGYLDNKPTSFDIEGHVIKVSVFESLTVVFFCVAAFCGWPLPLAVHCRCVFLVLALVPLPPGSTARPLLCTSF